MKKENQREIRVLASTNDAGSGRGILNAYTHLSELQNPSDQDSYENACNMLGIKYAEGEFDFSNAKKEFTLRDVQGDQGPMTVHYREDYLWGSELKETIDSFKPTHVIFEGGVGPSWYSPFKDMSAEYRSNFEFIYGGCLGNGLTRIISDRE